MDTHRNDHLQNDQIERIEDLAVEIDPALNYPEDWLIYRITGYRPEIDIPATLVGAALLGDLSALAERLSDAAALRAHELSGPTAPIEELRRRWRVSRKTLERWRRAGLLGLRVRDPSGGAHLVFPERVIRAFESRRRSSVDDFSDESRTRECRLQSDGTARRSAHPR